MPIPPLDKYYLNSSYEIMDSSGTKYTKNDLKTQITDNLNIKPNTNVPYPNGNLMDILTYYDPHTDELVELIADYYISLLETKQKTKQLNELEQSQNRITASQYHTDTNIQYKTQYIEIVNLTVGIVALLGGLFTVYKTN